METMLLLLILFTVNADPAMREKLRDFLSFYRENRDLIVAFTQNGAPVSETEPPKVQKEDPPEQGASPDRMLENFLAHAL